MPLRPYLCINGHTTEVLEPMDAPAKRDCPECGAEAFRQMAAANVARDGAYSYRPKEKSA